MIEIKGGTMQGANGSEQLLEEEVRQPRDILPSISPGEGSSSPLAHPSDRFVAQLNERWRVVDDPLQWILQQKKGNARSKNSGWRSRSFCRTREALLRCIREYCCLPDQGHAAFASIAAWTKSHCSKCVHSQNGT
jgi:hypothetical protein